MTKTIEEKMKYIKKFFPEPYHCLDELKSLGFRCKCGKLIVFDRILPENFLMKCYKCHEDYRERVIKMFYNCFRFMEISNKMGRKLHKKYWKEWLEMRDLYMEMIDMDLEEA